MPSTAEITARVPPPTAASTASSPQEIFYGTTPTQGAKGNVDEREAANFTAKYFGKTASSYLVRYVYKMIMIMGNFSINSMESRRLMTI
jgi:hypothetical protein